MESLGYDKNKVKVVINNFIQSYGISKAEVESVFKNELFCTDSRGSKKSVTVSVNKGEPFCDNA